ncbi:sortase [Ilumatobacter fluminis]|uniref:sortase n=1 Tax=Ilumatobacter fluminis TaxID=467091 RepID=UPI0010609F43|nr:sortase [Ilumatobacter fluminis]
MTDDLLGNDTDESDVGAAPTESGDDARLDERPADDEQAADERADDATTSASPTATSAWGRWRDGRRNRVSKWDRPPDPKDWRFFVGTLGKVLIATGILMFGFVAYQLWGTGIETARAQNALEDTFEAAVAANQAADDEDDEAESDDPVVTTPIDDEADDIDDADESADEPEPADGVGGGTPSEVVPGGVDLSDEAVVQNVPIVPPGDAIAKMEIPRIGIDDLFVVQGVKLDDLKKGPGHYPDTPLPGQLGNASIAGHRTTYGAPFFDVDQLQAGDEIIVTMITGDQFVYSVTGSQVVTAADSWVIGTRDPNVAELTLTTCHPKYTARDRLVIHSVLVPEKSAQVGQAEFWDAGTREVVVEADDDEDVDAGDVDAGDVDGGDESADADRPAGDDPTFDTGGDDPTFDGDEETVDGDGATGAKSQDDESDDRTDAVFLDPTPDSDDDAADAESPVAADESESDADDEAETAAADVESESDAEPVAVVDPDDAEIDAFSEGWFDDDEAWPQIALWGSILTIISLLAYQLSKKTRHDSIGFMVGIFPFLIALYFFFQNVNRLLPPGL